jgi:hypothetical protein
LLRETLGTRSREIVTREGLLVLLFLLAATRCWGRDAPERGDRTAMIQYLLLLATLSALCLLDVPTET